MEEEDLDTYLRVTATSVNQDEEINRIISLNRVTSNPAELLELNSKLFSHCELNQKEYKLQYRKKSLLCHPDKCKNPQAQEAFEILKQAESQLSDDEKRENLMQMFKDARAAVFKQRKIPIPTENEVEDPRLTSSEVIVAIKMEVRRLMKENSKRAAVLLSNEFERKAREADEQARIKKQQAEHNKAWEASREDRVQSWRSFQKGGIKKKKKKTTTNL
ncbi:hypothetical protein HK098_004007 [Nowakowskiella sp. JEL0407]|nr:hypothetical protein HK098_004007 [Nowakowskiella sp. JEL0407]